MGLLGSALGSAIGKAAGSAIGGKVGGSSGKNLGSEVGGILGGAAGSFLPFKNGGMVRKNNQKALLHKGELVVPSKLVKEVPKSLKMKIKAHGGRNM